MSTAKSTERESSYLGLVEQFPLRPITNTRDLDRAMNIAGHLATYDEGTLSPGEQDYLDTLTVLIEDYQRRQILDMPSVSPVAMLRHLMEEREMNISDLGRVIGSQSNASLILSGKREISKRVMNVLGHHFSVDPSVFLANSKRTNTEGQPMNIELNDWECYIAATALHVTAMEIESDVAAEDSMEARHWALERIGVRRRVMQRIDQEWRELFGKMYPGPIAGIEKEPVLNRKIGIDVDDRELQEIIESLDVSKEEGIGTASAPDVKALLRKLIAQSKLEHDK